MDYTYSVVPNWIPEGVPQHMKELGHRLIDAGAWIVFGHSAHHVPVPSHEVYQGGLIIYGLGDLVNDYAAHDSIDSTKALMCRVDTNDQGSRATMIPVRRRRNRGSASIPTVQAIK